MATSTLGNGTLVLAGTTSGTTTVTATAVAGTTTLTLPAATDTLVGRATTDTLTNKTLTGAAMNGTLGATTPSTGAFTTLTSTGASSFATSSGDVGIGTSSPNSKLQVNSGTNLGGVLIGFNGGSSNFYDADAQYWRTGNGTERMRLDSSGNLLVGTTSGSKHMLVKDSASDTVLIVRNTSGTTPYGQVLNFSAASPNDATRYFLQCNDSTAERATIRSNGGIANYQANNVNLSDLREKTNFAPAKSYLDVICAIPVQTFNYIDQNLEEDAGLTLGVVAQDVQTVAPELVMESDWSSEKDGSKMRLSIYQTDLQYALMKALQELKAEFDAYKASHP